MSGDDRLFCVGCLFTVGVALSGVYTTTKALVGICLTAVTLLAVTGLLAKRRERLRSAGEKVMWVCAALLAGTLIMGVQVLRGYRLSESLSKAPGTELKVRGVIVDTRETDDEGKLRATLIPDAFKGRRLLLTISLRLEDDVRLQEGHVIEASGRFYAPRIPANPGEPDIGRSMAARKLVGTLYVKGIEDIRILGWVKPGLIPSLAMLFRETVKRTNTATLSERHALVLNGMLLGEAPTHMKSGLESTGTAHLFAASGLHVGYVALAVMMLLFPLARHRQGVLVVVMFVWIYATACGLRSSVVRAALMLTLACFGKIMGRTVSTRSTLVLSCILMLAVNPYTVFDAGAQLSFFSVLAILHLYPRLSRLFVPLGSTLSRAFALSASAGLGVAPLLAWYFQVFTPIGIIANVPCVALAGFAVPIGLCAALAGIVSSHAALLLNSANSLILQGLEKSIEFFSKVPLGSFSVVRPPFWLMAGYYMGIIALGFPRRIRKIISARANLVFLILLVLCVGSVMYAVMKPAEVETVFLSVGQGDAIFISTAKGKSLLIDGGGIPGGTRDPGRDTILPFLRRRGIDHIDIVVATHPHYDHIGGLFAVLESCRVGALLKPEIPQHMVTDVDYTLVSLAKERDIPVVELVHGGRIDAGDGVKISVLNPQVNSEEGSIHFGTNDLNDLSLVMKVEYSEFGMLLTGDVSRTRLSRLLDMGKSLDADVLKVPHHGARDALDVSITGAIRPRVSVISVGPNAFSHPSPATVAILEDAGNIVFRTDLDGAVVVTTDGKRIRVGSIGSRRFHTAVAGERD